MARARNIKPGLFKNEVLGVADPLLTLLFEGLWLLADREGRLEDRPLRIKAEVFPYREGIDMNAMLGWLETSGFIRRYRVSGLAFIEVVAFVKHQNPHKNEPESVIPSSADAESTPERIGSSPDFLGSAPADSLSLDSGFRIDSTPDKPPSSIPAERKKRKTPMPADFVVSERVRKWAAEKGYDRLDEHLEALKRKVAANGYEKISWDDFLMEAIREDWAKLRGRTQAGTAPPPDIRKPVTSTYLAEQAAHRAAVERERQERLARKAA